MKKVAIFTINDDNNYGNRLQNYAVQKSLENLGMEVNTVINTTIKRTKKKNVVKIAMWKLKVLISNIIYRIHKRKVCFEKFNKNIKFYSEKINENNIPIKLKNDFDLYITGSDQVWNPNFHRMSDIDFLTLANENKRCSFSASFGISEIPENLKEFYKDRLSKIKYLSVREDSGKEIIKKLTNRDDVEVLIDPTMMLNAEEWDKVSEKPKQMNLLKKKKYILNYFLGKLSEERKQEIKRIADENDCEIINILDKKSPFYHTGPSEFLWLEKNAFLICTDSFHSSVFAILYNIPFIVFDREDKNISMNSRIETLINKFKLKNRKFNGKNITMENLNHNYEEAYEILEQERMKTKSFLNNALNK